MNDFQKLPSTIKGNTGESWVILYLESLGYKLLWETGHQSTPFDGIGYSGESVRNLFEVKINSMTKHKSYSIHENDIQVYCKAELSENKPMIILYVDPSTKELNVTTTKRIRETTVIRHFDRKEKKYLLYFTGFTKKADLPEELCQQLINISI